MKNVTILSSAHEDITKNMDPTKALAHTDIDGGVCVGVFDQLHDSIQVCNSCGDDLVEAVKKFKDNK